MKVKKLLQILDTISPFELQEGWDNSGLQVGNLENDCGEISIALDLDDEMIKELPENSTLLTHHPLIFSSLKTIEQNSYPSKYIFELIRKNINLISLHTNFDKTHLNIYVAKEILGFSDCENSDFVVEAKIDKSFDELLEFVREKFSLENVTFVKGKEKIETVSLTTGSGGSMISNIKTDCYLTGDIKYHDAILAKSLGISLIDITHFHSEKYFGEILHKELQNNNVHGIIRLLNNPFSYK
ncbi:MAG: Nif3-like dinuclear metal center hexameric protein [Campylobacterales bacterium]|nr:Nif3-like dinuclear metal center hexameric protein [Campylobacterales bacterium]